MKHQKMYKVTYIRRVSGCMVGQQLTFETPAENLTEAEELFEKTKESGFVYHIMYWG